MAVIPPLVGTENEDTSPLPVWQHLVGADNSLRVQANEGRAANNDDKGHGDSWGVGWFDAKGEASLIRQTGSAYDSAYFVFASESAARGGAGSGPGRVVIGHLRKASCGAVTSENAHPIRVDFAGAKGPDTLLLAHNGTIRKPLLDTLRDDLKPTPRPEKASDSDTVVLAGWLSAQLETATEMDPNASLFDTLTQALKTLFERAVTIAPGGDLTQAYSSVCLLIAHHSGLFALRQFTKEPDYYTLYYRPLTDDWQTKESAAHMVSSEPTESAKCASLPPGELRFYPTAVGATMQWATVAPPFAG